MRLTLRHRFQLGADAALVDDDLDRPEAWDALRTGTDGPFALPATREAWEAAAEERADVRERARQIDAWLDARAVRRLASYGAGVALPELWLKRLSPEREIAITDYAPATVERLRFLFPEAEVIRHNLLVDQPLQADVHLFHRIDSEFTNAQWRSILGRYSSFSLLVVATDVLALRGLLGELLLRRPGSHATRAGWIRTRGAFEALWRPTHRATRLTFHDLEAWSLEPRAA